MCDYLEWNDNYYYVCGYSDHEQKTINYRVDRMCNIGIMHEEGEPIPEGFSANEYGKKHFRRFAGDDVEVIL